VCLRGSVRAAHVDAHPCHRGEVLRCVVHAVFQICLSFLHRDVVRVVLRF
jgi:hypothetical protein